MRKSSGAGETEAIAITPPRLLVLESPPNEKRKNKKKFHDENFFVTLFETAPGAIRKPFLKENAAFCVP